MPAPVSVSVCEGGRQTAAVEGDGGDVGGGNGDTGGGRRRKRVVSTTTEGLMIVAAGQIKFPMAIYLHTYSAFSHSELHARETRLTGHEEEKEEEEKEK
ncbi:hypothetical protein E2C01_097265 [Portunus trituberculatus]|uniref:Uncharacterized protein n=1 Tax=Portunus trituberculatus TaxID=210409 RepID=A0A5B7KAS9_PORTR|nr:hypothetical protein [Portunus trituberculatus]